MTAIAFRPRKSRKETTLSVTPLIDVLFLLIIFFMMTGTFKRVGELELQLPSSSSSQASGSPEEQTEIEIVVMENGDVQLGGVPVSVDALPGALKELHTETPDQRVLLKAEDAVPHGTIVRILDAVRNSGFQGVGIGTHMSPVPVTEGTDAP